jgi:hypothetical protein
MLLGISSMYYFNDDGTERFRSNIFNFLLVKFAR